MVSRLHSVLVMYFKLSLPSKQHIKFSNENNNWISNSYIEQIFKIIEYNSNGSINQRSSEKKIVKIDPRDAIHAKIYEIIWKQNLGNIWKCANKKISKSIKCKGSLANIKIENKKLG